MSKIEIYRGTSYPVVYNHKDSAGTAEALTGCTLYFTVKADKFDSSSDDSSAIIKKTVLPDGHTNAATGVSGFTLTDSDTYVAPGNYYYVFLIEQADGRTDPPSVFGKFVVLPQPGNRQVLNG